MIFPLLALVALPSSARAKETLEYMDLLTTEAVGELSTQTYDERIDKKFVGTREAAGVLVGGGIGIRPVFRFANGLRFSIEVSGTWGRLRDADPGVAYSTVTRAEFLTGLGYEVHVGRALALHTATLVGLDGQWMDRAQQIALFDASTVSSPIASSSLSRVDLRLGQQVGAHVQLAKAVALYADGTIDYDGQWRVRAGIAIGQILR
ncbi:MAG: hypothetical protein JWM53_813 [bacterium]|nr:hypothetical protein [bacterium]